MKAILTGYPYAQDKGKIEDIELTEAINGHMVIVGMSRGGKSKFVELLVKAKIQQGRKPVLS